MADPWTYKLDVVYLADKVANVTATRTDGTDVRTYTLPTVSFAGSPSDSLSQIRERIATTMYAKYLADKANEALAAQIATQEGLLATATNAKEGT